MHRLDTLKYTTVFWIISCIPFIQVTASKLKIKGIGSDMGKIKNIVMALVRNWASFDSPLFLTFQVVLASIYLLFLQDHKMDSMEAKQVTYNLSSSIYIIFNFSNEYSKFSSTCKVSCLWKMDTTYCLTMEVKDSSVFPPRCMI
jgi:hypothetical protein